MHPIREKLLKLEEERDKKIQKIKNKYDKQINEIKQQCTHTYEDGSRAMRCNGAPDNEYYCEICGKWL